MPVGPFRRVERTCLSEIGERLLNGSACVGPWWRRRIAGTLRRPLEIEAIDPWEESNVRIDEELPVFGTAAPRERLGQGGGGNTRGGGGVRGRAESSAW